MFGRRRDIPDPAPAKPSEGPAVRTPSVTTRKESAGERFDQAYLAVQGVLYDRIDDERIYAFIERMTVSGRLFTFQIPTPDPAQPAPTPDPTEERETLMLAVSGSTHVTDARSGWGENYYEQAVEVCKTLSGTPVLFEPIEGAWLTAVPDPEAAPGTSVTWDAATLGLSLAGAVNGPIWIDPVPAVLLWRYQRTLPDSVTFNEDGVYYRIYLQVPGITRRAPPPPAA
jgi:hypothetical protein